jgi:DNA-damage-inducible protein D
MINRLTESPSQIITFQDKNIRRVWDKVGKKWYFSVVDIIQILIDQQTYLGARKYWNKLSERLREEGSETVTKCHRLKLLAEDGKMRLTDTADIETLFRIIQSVPSPKAEPVKLWLARVGYERVSEIENPELAQERMKYLYEQKGYPKDWVDKRLRGIAIRQNLTDEWKERGIEGKQNYAILTAEISKATFGVTPSEYKKLKRLKRENLRDHMNDLELIFTMLGERVTTEISQKEKPETFTKNRRVAVRGGGVAGRARKETEKEIGRSVISKENYLPRRSQKSLK